MTPRTVRFAAIVMLAACVFVGCGKKKNNASTTNTTKTEDIDVTMKNFAFSPTSYTAKAGSSVHAANKDHAPHTITSDDGTSFDTGNIAPGTNESFTAPSTPGTYAYHCKIHATMHGSVTVTA